MAKKPPPPSLGLVLVRLVTGLVLLRHGWRWVTAGGVDGRTVRRHATEAIADLGGVLAWWGETLLLGNPDAIAFLWRWAALLCGLCLLLGALTRPAGWIATLFLLHAYAYGPASEALTFLLLLVCSLACALSRAGRRLGLDPMFDAHFPPWLTWTRSQGTFLG